MPGKGKPFVKGDPRAGRPRKPKDVAKAAKLTRTEAEALLTQFMHMDITELEGVLKDKKRKVIEHIIGRVALMAIKNGDHARLNFVLDRLIGKVKENLEVSVVKPTFLKRYDSDEVIELGAEEVKEGGETSN